ncbi:hypothetical protein FLK61_34190 [Paenalkalicoccus suaedae]|uniref:Uncharacterized protein n=1 Tax=Paenalkalicoccus suaedae TaxID=2592382 RepID=A0A859FF13_9BACI|nr:hypothetical protein [Paenalkalicoccus suaedae]QKS71677.1 hypothetical protein FLK61_33895 [Paenalkalicoccus suaedae]QKS71729.1 hypothetical protein FLK61_34190 [Paenalkalicoccus suaedae]
MKQVRVIKCMSPHASDCIVYQADPEELQKRYPRRVRPPDEQEEIDAKMMQLKISYELSDKSRYRY